MTKKIHIMLFSIVLRLCDVYVPEATVLRPSSHCCSNESAGQQGTGGARIIMLQHITEQLAQVSVISMDTCSYVYLPISQFGNKYKNNAKMCVDLQDITDTNRPDTGRNLKVTSFVAQMPESLLPAAPFPRVLQPILHNVSTQHMAYISHRKPERTYLAQASRVAIIPSLPDIWKISLKRVALFELLTCLCYFSCF